VLAVAVLAQKVVLLERVKAAEETEQIVEVPTVVMLLLTQEVVAVVLVGAVQIPQVAATAALALSSLKYLTT
jgi:hypothetical protein